jgi:hypothetical protein
MPTNRFPPPSEDGSPGGGSGSLDKSKWSSGISLRWVGSLCQRYSTGHPCYSSYRTSVDYQGNPESDSRELQPIREERCSFSLDTGGAICPIRGLIRFWVQNVAIQPTWQICHSERSEESGLLHGQRRSFAPLRMTTSHLKPEKPIRGRLLGSSILGPQLARFVSFV